MFGYTHKDGPIVGPILHTQIKKPSLSRLQESWRVLCCVGGWMVIGRVYGCLTPNQFCGTVQSICTNTGTFGLGFALRFSRSPFPHHCYFLERPLKSETVHSASELAPCGEQNPFRKSLCTVTFFGSQSSPLTILDWHPSVTKVLV